jgi:hypothetical protein
MVWASCGEAEDFDKKTTYYYLPVKGFEALGLITDVKAMHTHLKNSEVFRGTVYGVRKGDLAFIKTQKNWINLDKHVVAVLSKLGTENVMSLVKQSIGWGDFYKNGVTKHLSQVDSPYMGLFNAFKDVKAPKGGDYQRAVQFLCQVYKITTATKTDPTALVKKWQAVIDDLNKRYPLLKHLDGYRIDAKEVAEYITLVDKAQ